MMNDILDGMWHHCEHEFKTEDIPGAGLCYICLLCGCGQTEDGVKFFSVETKPKESP